MSDETEDYPYSEVADEQLDKLELADPRAYDDVMVVCEDILENPSHARSRSAAIQTREGIRFRTSVPGSRYKIFWSAELPRIEAVFPYP